MKYKIITIIIICTLVIGCISIESYYKKDITTVYHQHLEDSSDESACAGIENCSHLPIINVDTKSQTIPGLDGEKENYIIAEANIYDGGNSVTVLGENGNTETIRLRYRGRSSLKFDKKGYLLKFVNDNDEKVNKSLLGMPEETDWIFHGPFIDKSLIRNYMWYNIAQEIMGQAPKTRFFELYIDNNYQGLYVATEAVTQSEQSRVLMTKKDERSIATSYLLQLDSDAGNETTALNSFSKYTYRLKKSDISNENIIIKYPSEAELTEEVKEYISNDFAEFEKMLYSYDYKEYSKYIDVDSFVDYFIINEFTQNYDAGYLSTYIYKDIAGKYKMYIWDFNSASNNYQPDFLGDNQSFELDGILWYEALLQDPEFVEAIIKRYEELRKTYLSYEYLENYIDETVSYLGPAIDRNFSVWGYTLNENYGSFKTNYMPRSHNDAINQLKSSIHERGKWMDRNIYILRHYAHESKNKDVNK